MKYLFVLLMILFAGITTASEGHVVAHIGDLRIMVDKETPPAYGKAVEKVFNVLIEKFAREHAISITPGEISNRFNEILKQGNISDETIAKLANKSNKILDALQVWLNDQDRGNEIYVKNLKDLISLDEWHAWQKNIKSKADIAKLRKMVPSSMDDAKANSSEGIRKDLIREKVYNALTERIALDPNEYNDQVAASLVGKEKINEANVAEAALKWKKAFVWTTWMRGEIERAGVVFNNAEFKKALFDYLKNEEGNWLKMRK